MARWTEADDDKLRQLYADEFSCSQIAGHFPGKSRCAIIGRVHRLNLPRRGAGRAPMQARRSGRRSSPRRAAPVTAPPPAEVVMRCAAIEPLHLAITELDSGHCRWPYGDGPFTFCGHSKFTGSYCTSHYFLSRGPGIVSEKAAHRVSEKKIGAW